MLQCMNIIVPMLDTFCVNSALGMMDAMIAPHLKHTGSSNFEIGMGFMLAGLSFVIGSVFFGEVYIFQFEISNTVFITFSSRI